MSNNITNRMEGTHRFNLLLHEVSPEEYNGRVETSHRDCCGSGNLDNDVHLIKLGVSSYLPFH